MILPSIIKDVGKVMLICYWRKCKLVQSLEITCHHLVELNIFMTYPVTLLPDIHNRDTLAHEH